MNPYRELDPFKCQKLRPFHEQNDCPKCGNWQEAPLDADLDHY